MCVRSVTVSLLEYSPRLGQPRKRRALPVPPASVIAQLQKRCPGLRYLGIELPATFDPEEELTMTSDLTQRLIELLKKSEVQRFRLGYEERPQESSWADYVRTLDSMLKRAIEQRTEGTSNQQKPAAVSLQATSHRSNHVIHPASRSDRVNFDSDEQLLAERS